MASRSAGEDGASVTPVCMARASTWAIAVRISSSRASLTVSWPDWSSAWTRSDRFTLPRVSALPSRARSAASSPSIQSGTRRRRSSPLPLTLRKSHVQPWALWVPVAEAKAVIELSTGIPPARLRVCPSHSAPARQALPYRAAGRRTVNHLVGILGKFIRNRGRLKRGAGNLRPNARCPSHGEQVSR